MDYESNQIYWERSGEGGEALKTMAEHYSYFIAACYLGLSSFFWLTFLAFSLWTGYSIWLVKFNLDAVLCSFYRHAVYALGSVLQIT